MIRRLLAAASVAVCAFASVAVLRAETAGRNHGFDDGDYGGDFGSDLEFAPAEAINKYGKTLPPDKQENYSKPKKELFKKNFIDLYLIKSDPGDNLCDSIQCYGNSPPTVKFVADAIILGRKDEDAETGARYNTRNAAIASISAMLSAVISLATLFVTLRKTERST